MTHEKHRVRLVALHFLDAVKLRSRIGFGKLLAAAVLFVFACGFADAQSRIVAIGDVHGSLPQFESMLKEMKLLDAKHGDSGQWTGGQTTFVQTGDIVDRGPKSRACLDLLMNLERSSQKQKKGKVVILLGNHEIMAVTGDLRYVVPEDFQGFATPQSEKVRQAAYRDYQDFLSERKRAGVAPAKTDSREKWMADHPAGYFERRDAFGPQGVYGRWLRQHNVAYIDNGGVFVHGGLSPSSAFDNIDSLNAQMRGALAAFDRGWQSLVNAGIIWRYMSIDEAIVEIQRERAAIPMRETDDPKQREELDKFIELLTWINSPDNPTWYRGLAQEPEPLLGPSVQAMMARLKINFIVAGHTPAPQPIRQRFENRVFLIDTGMVASDSDGHASALEIVDGRFVAHLLGQAPQNLPAPGTPSEPESNPPVRDGTQP
jgi:hypothetical protein